MLLKAGTVMILVSLLLAAGVAVAVVLRSERAETAALSAEPQGAVVKTQEKGKFDPGQKLEIDDGAGKDEETRKDGGSSEDYESRKDADTAEEPVTESLPRLNSSPAPIPAWPQPTHDELTSANQPRYYQPSNDADMMLTIAALGLYDVPVLSSADLGVLDQGLMHEPETSLPWDGSAQRNVFLAGHYLGWPGTASHLVFYNLDKLRRGDEVVLRDNQGRAYRYWVSEAFEATPEDSWVMGQVRNRDMLTLQTCVPPTFEERLVVRADRA